MAAKAFSSKVPWRSDAVDVEQIGWPRYLEYIAFGLPLLIGLGILIQRDALLSWSIDTAIVLLAVLPWVLGLARVRVPRPVTVVVMLAAVALLFSGAGTGNVPGEDISPFFLVVLAMHMGALAPLAQSLTVLVLSIGTLVAVESFAPCCPHPAVNGADPHAYAHAIPWYIGVTAGWIGGYMIQSQLRVLIELKAAQAGLAERAAADERQRIARELHDVIAHSLTVTMLHITGARKALERDPAEAADALREAERLGRQSLSDVRRVVGVLGAGESSQHPPMPAMVDLEKLVNDVKAAGADVTLEMQGDLGAVAPTTGLALYRIVQESLTNAAKHAPGAPTRISVAVQNGHVSLEVTNPVPDGAPAEASGDGLGLWGMKERVRVLGGTFEAGPQGDRWVVRVKAPTAARA